MTTLPSFWCWAFAVSFLLASCNGGQVLTHGASGSAPAHGGSVVPAPAPDPGAPPPPSPPPPGGAPAPLPGPKLAVYWGTGNDQGADPPLAEVCAKPQYDIIILSFANTTTGRHTRNADGYPELSINGCDTPYNARNPHILKCDALAVDIDSCHKNGKQVLLSIGGGGAQVG